MSLCVGEDIKCVNSTVCVCVGVCVFVCGCRYICVTLSGCRCRRVSAHDAVISRVCVCVCVCIET